jgi:hypothetical protein
VLPWTTRDEATDRAYRHGERNSRHRPRVVADVGDDAPM